MTTHSENLTRVQQELWYLIRDEDVRKVLEAMIEKMKEVGDGSERLKQWREEAKAYIPDNPRYDENYWVAAYILYTNMEKFKDLFERLDNISSELSELEDELEELQHEQEELEYRIEDLRYELETLLEEDEDDDEEYNEEWEEDEEDEDEENEDEEEDEEIADLRYQIEQLEEELEDIKERYEEASDRFYGLEGDKKYLLWDIMELAEQLVAS
jgi:chromosome segregation ATPase